MADLTSRQREVAALLAEGLTYRGAGQRLGISHETVKNHASHVRAKWDLVGATQVEFATAVNRRLAEERG